MKKRILFLAALTMATVQIAFSQCIQMQPTSAILCPVTGSEITVSIASGSATPSYTWQYRVVTSATPNPAWITITSANAGGVYSNYTSSDLKITKTATLPKAGTQYRNVIDTPECGTTISDIVNLYVLPPVKAGTIASDASVCVGNAITFSLAGYSGNSFQWESAPSSTGVFSAIPGENGTSYTIPQTFLNTDKSYRVVVTDEACGTTVVSPVKTIKIDPIAVAGVVSGGGTICPNSTTVLKLTGYTGRIQWEYSKNGSKFQKVPTSSSWNATYPFQTSSTNLSSASYNVSNLSSPVVFRARVSSGLCYETISNTVLCSNGTMAIAGVVSPSNSTVCSGTSNFLDLSGSDGAVTWEKSTNWTSANPTWFATTNHTLTMNTATQTVSTAYRAKISVGNCSDQSTVFSNVAVVNLISKPVAKAISVNTTIPSGTSLSNSLCLNDTSKILTIGAGSVGAIQWQTSATGNAADYIDIDGETAVSYTVTNPIEGANYYKAKFTNTCNSAVFSPAVIVYYEDCGTGLNKVSQNEFQGKSLSNVTAYPNPFSRNCSLNGNTSESCTIRVYESTGRLIESREISSGEMTSQSFGDVYPSGVYNLVIRQGNETKTLRIIKK